MWSMKDCKGTTTQEHDETGVELSNNEYEVNGRMQRHNYVGT